MALTAAQAVADILGFGLMAILVICLLVAAGTIFIGIHDAHLRRLRWRCCCSPAGVEKLDRWGQQMHRTTEPSLLPAYLWLSEGLLTLLLPWVAFGAGAAVAAASAESSTVPAALLGLCLPQVLRVKVLERLDIAEIWRLQAAEGEYSAVDGALQDEDPQKPLNCCARCCKSLRSCLSTVWRVGISTLEVVDGTSDGLAVAKAFFLSREVQQSFRTAWSAAAWPLGPMVAALGPGAAMALALAYTTSCQLGALLSMVVNREAAVAFADFSGAGRLAEVLQQLIAQHSGGGDPYAQVNTLARSMSMSAVRAFTENALQLLLQTSLIAATGRGLVADPVLAVSVCLSYGTLLLKWCGLMADGFKARHSYNFRAMLLVFVIPSVLPLGALLAYLGAKLYFIHTCDSHEWGLSTGCMPV